MKHNKILSLATLAVLSVFGIHHFAYATVPTDSSDVDVEVNVHQRITVALSADTVTLNLKPTISTDFDSSDITATVVTNNLTGYTLTMSPADDTTTYLTRVDGTETIPTLTPLEGGYTEQTFTTNTWGYKLVNTNYLNFATSNEIIVTDAPTAGTSSVVTFGAKGDTNLHSGAYELEIAFTAVANAVLPTDYDVTVSMDSNTESVTFSDGTTTQTATQSNPAVSLAENTSYTITATFATGYELGAWSATAGTLGSTTANPTTYTTTSASTLSVTSKQSQVGPAPLSTCTTPVPGITYMQEITNQNKATVMASMTPNQQYYLRDRRDETPYCVSNITTKNANNEDQNAIWMTQNLRITGTISATDSNFTGSDFNVSAYDLKTDGTSGKACYYSSGGHNNACSHVPDADDLTTTGLTAEELGVWYNYSTATAGTITGDFSYTEATEDICPAGWSLPSYDTTKPANSVNSLGNGSSTYVSTFKPVTGGLYSSGSHNNTGLGFWWSTTADTGSNRIYLKIGSNLDTDCSNRSSGMYVRCVKQ